MISNNNNRGPRQFISLARLNQDHQLSQFQVDQLAAFAAPYPVLWRCGQLDKITALAAVRRMKGLA